MVNTMQHGGFLLWLPLLASGCTQSSAFVVVTVEDPLAVASGATQLAIGDAAGTLVTWSLKARQLPLAVTITRSEVGSMLLAVEARDGANVALGRATVMASFARAGYPAATARLGKACASDTECKDPKYSVCHLEGAAGYCTSACETSEDCDRTLNYACDYFGAVGVCERPPTGEGHACATSADCAGFEADYCEAFREKKCLRQGCKQNPSICHGDWVCCDISVLGTSLCIPPDALESGACPGGGTLIPRGE